MMPSETLPHFVCLDSAHWVGLTGDLCASERRQSVVKRIVELESSDAVLVLTQHHLLELIQYGNVDVALARVESLRQVPTIATAESDHLPHLGSVVDLLAQEMSVALQAPSLDAAEVASVVKSSLFFALTGDSLCDAVLQHFEEYRRHALDQVARQREISMVGQSVVLKRSKEPFHHNGKLRDAAEIDARFDEMQDQFSEEVARRKDPRMHGSSVLSKSFVDSLRSSKPAMLKAVDPVALMLKSFGVSRADVEDCRTVGDVEDVVQFRHQLLVAGRSLGLAAVDHSTIRQSQIPTFLVQRAMIRHRAVAARVSGSDLPDSHLLAWAPYVDSLFVDKRTLENVRRISSRQDEAAQFLGGVSKASSWSAALDQVKAKLLLTPAA